VHDHLEVVRIHDDPVERLIDEHSAFLIAGSDPHLIDVERGEGVEDFLESSSEVVLVGDSVLVHLCFGSHGFDLATELGLFGPEQLAADSPLVVQLFHEEEWRARGVRRDSTSCVQLAVQKFCTDLRCRFCAVG
jgi:hypothetical protein